MRANAIVLNSAVSAYARNRPPLRTPARKLPRDMQRWGFPPTTVRTSVSVRRRALSMLLGHGVLGHEPLSVCEVA